MLLSQIKTNISTKATEMAIAKNNALPEKERKATVQPVVISQLELNTANDMAGNKTEWMRHWDNDNRIAISIHKELVTELKANPAINSLGLQHETRTGEQGSYESYRIVKYTEAEETL